MIQGRLQTTAKHALAITIATTMTWRWKVPNGR